MLNKKRNRISGRKWKGDEKISIKKTATLELSLPFGNVDFVMSLFGVTRGAIRLNLNTEYRTTHRM